ncbi:hypothetical protein ACXN5S_12530 [Pseudoroseicyclus sp. H15]
MARTTPRDTPAKMAGIRNGALAASALAFAGALLMRNAAGYLLPGATATGSVGVGRISKTADNSGGSAGDLAVDFEEGVFLFDNSASGDAITIADIGEVAWIVDDETVAKTDGTGTRSPAGIIQDVSAAGVWVRFDEALTRAAMVADEALATASA